MHRRSIGEDWFVEAPRGFPLDSSWWPTYETTFAFFDRVLTDDKTINLENLSPVFFHPFFSIRDESEARAHSTWKNFRGEMRTFAEVRRNSSAVYLSTPHQLLTQGSIRAFRRSNQDSLLMQQDIYAWTVRTYWRAETSNRKTRLICL